MDQDLYICFAVQFTLVAYFVAGVAANGYDVPSLVRLQPAPYARAIRSTSYGSSSARFVPITRFSHEIKGSQSDSVAYENGNGISNSDLTEVVVGHSGAYVNGSGKMVQSDSIIRKDGAYSYSTSEKQHISTTWVAFQYL